MTDRKRKCNLVCGVWRSVLTHVHVLARVAYSTVYNMVYTWSQWQDQSEDNTVGQELDPDHPETSPSTSSITGVIWTIETHSANTHSLAVGLSKAIEVIILSKSIEGLHTASRHFSSAIRVMKALHPQVPQQTLLYWKGQLQMLKMLKWRNRCAFTLSQERAKSSHQQHRQTMWGKEVSMPGYAQFASEKMVKSRWKGWVAQGARCGYTSLVLLQVSPVPHHSEYCLQCITGHVTIMISDEYYQHTVWAATVHYFNVGILYLLCQKLSTIITLGTTIIMHWTPGTIRFTIIPWNYSNQSLSALMRFTMVFSNVPDVVYPH